jgi:type IV pilus assembly protein PilA
MLTKSRCRAANEQGFTLIELLLVILIIGILAAIAIPSFLNQRSKGYDAAAKTNLRSAETAMETYSTDHDGKYPATVNTKNGAAEPLVGIEPSLSNAPYVTGGSTSTGYTLTSQAVGPGANGDTFVVTLSNGVVTRTCSGSNGGCTNSSW